MKKKSQNKRKSSTLVAKPKKQTKMQTKKTSISKTTTKRTSIAINDVNIKWFNSAIKKKYLETMDEDDLDNISQVGIVLSCDNLQGTKSDYFLSVTILFDDGEEDDDTFYLTKSEYTDYVNKLSKYHSW